MSGTKYSIKVIRGGKEKIFILTVAERKDKPETALAKDQSAKAYFGIIAQGTYQPEISRRLGIPRDAGVIIIDVENEQPRRRCRTPAAGYCCSGKLR